MLSVVMLNAVVLIVVAPSLNVPFFFVDMLVNTDRQILRQGEMEFSKNSLKLLTFVLATEKKRS